ncbi:hypothetical protein GCM10010207_62050 [Streptomyces atratus]|nr:hypothetical protein GCM10010207_62050 [Streptomyces atratus]
MVFVASAHTAGSEKEVRVFSNTDRVLLYQNGRLVGEQTRADNAATAPNVAAKGGSLYVTFEQPGRPPRPCDDGTGSTSAQLNHAVDRTERTAPRCGSGFGHRCSARFRAPPDPAAPQVNAIAFPYRFLRKTPLRLEGDTCHLPGDHPGRSRDYTLSKGDCVAVGMFVRPASVRVKGLASTER